jgi:RND family efflux transporter MFP subunit
MYKNGSLPEIKFVEIETSVQQTKSATAIAKKNLDDCNLYLPVDGYVGKRSMDPGMNAIPSVATINIVKIEKVFAKVPIPENEIASIKKGEKASIKVSAIGLNEIFGTVEEIGVMADPLSHSYKIKISINNKDKKLKPGMVCNVIINDDKDKHGLIIPNQSVLIDNDRKNFVYVVEGNTAKRKYIQTGDLVNNGIMVISGLNENDNVVTAGMQKLVDNSNVQIINR